MIFLCLCLYQLKTIRLKLCLCICVANESVQRCSALPSCRWFVCANCVRARVYVHDSFRSFCEVLCTLGPIRPFSASSSSALYFHHVPGDPWTLAVPLFKRESMLLLKCLQHDRFFFSFSVSFHRVPPLVPCTASPANYH